MKIKICIPYYKEYEACKGGIAELRSRKDHEFTVITGKSYDPAHARNGMVSSSQKKWQVDLGGFTHFMFVDSDISFKARDVLRLLEYDKDIVSGAYVRRDDQNYFQGGFWHEDLPGNIKNYVSSKSGGLHRVDYVGGGFLLVKAEALIKMEYPWFRRVLIDNGELQAEVQEDYGFCMNARDHGVEVWLSCDVEVDHVIDTRNPDDPNVIPASVSEDVMKITEALTRIGRKYSLCYNQLVSARENLKSVIARSKLENSFANKLMAHPSPGKKRRKE